MSDLIDHKSFKAGHVAFLEHMRTESGGVHFTGFDHPFLLKEEIAYKLAIYAKAYEDLSLAKWPNWKLGSGRIRDAVRSACRPELQINWLEHRFGPRAHSPSPVYVAESPAQVKGLEQALYNFFLDGPSEPDALGPRFDQLAKYFRDQRLGCKWPFLAHLAFLLRPQTYFPIHPGKFETLLRFYRVDIRILRNVRWEVYRTILDVAEELKDQLVLYGRPNAIEVQSYMYVVAYLQEVIGGETLPDTAAFDFVSEMNRRKHRPEERERTGLLGEQFVFDEERRKLSEAGWPDLANKLRLVAAVDSSAGYDILSFDVDGSERHIEVKTTESPRSLDQGFWLSEGERRHALEDESWCLYRVWSIYDDPFHEDLGNIAKNDSSGWTLNHASWHVTPNGAVS